MPNKYSSEKKTIGELLSTTTPPIVVPDWQRNYSWESSYVEAFWYDLVNFSSQYPGENINEQEYFLGSIVLVNSGTNHLLLDGQQRLGTATILLSVIRDYLKEYSSDAATRAGSKYIADFDDATGANSFKLTLNIYDREFFRREVQETSEGAAARPEPNLGSHTLIRNARNYLVRKFEEKYQELNRGKTAFDWALRVRKVLTDHVSVVAVASTDEENASAVFETLNDRGIGLSAPDLLRNLLLRRANESERAEIINGWQVVLEMEEDTKVDDFLRHYWLSHHGDVKTRSLYKEIRHDVISRNESSVVFTRSLKRSASLYRELVSGRDDDPELQRFLRSVSMLGAKSLWPAILSGWEVGELDKRKKLIKALIALFVRHNVIGSLENSKLENVVFEVARRLRSNQDFDGATVRFKELAPSDAEFIEQFKNARVSRQSTARYILREIEHCKRRTGEVAVEAPDRVHLEHIYPQNPRQGSQWENHVSAVDRIGNLTLLSSRMNEAIKNGPFGDKKPTYVQSDLLITKELAQFDDWTFDSVKIRQERLSQLALNIWSFT
jgi:hypothetical protein